VPPKNPLGKIKDAATGAAVNVVGTVAETVKDPVAKGQQVVGTAVGQAVAVAGAVSTRLPRRRRAAAPEPPAQPVAVPQEQSRKVQGDPVRPAETTAPVQKAVKKPAKKAVAKKAPSKKAAVTAPAKAAAKKSPAKKTAAKKAPAKKAPAKKAAAKRSAAKAPAKKVADLSSGPDSTVQTKPLLDPALTKAVKSESDTGARASEVEKG
jgi:hypothetical protein